MERENLTETYEDGSTGRRVKEGGGGREDLHYTRSRVRR